MRTPDIDDRVQLRNDIPELSLRCGDRGVVRSTWFAPAVAFEVEFEAPGLNNHTRALLMAEQIELFEARERLA